MAYTYGIFSSRKIERFSAENKVADWLTQGQYPSYRTICRFRISDELTELNATGLQELTQYLKQHDLIGDQTFIDGTKILADANKYSFVWKKNIIRFDEMNREKLITILGELQADKVTDRLPNDTNINMDELTMIIDQVQDRLIDLDAQVAETRRQSPNPYKQQRRHLKGQRRQLKQRRAKLMAHQADLQILGARSSCSKTNHDATFMRVKEDPMMNWKLKPAYNLQIATSNQFITGFDLSQSPTDTRTLPTFLTKLKQTQASGKYIVADTGYGSESNYQFAADELPERTFIAPYSGYLKEKSRKWQSAERKGHELGIP